MEIVQKGFVTTIHILESDNSLTGAILVKTVAELFPLAVLFERSLSAVTGLLP